MRTFLKFFKNTFNRSYHKYRVEKRAKEKVFVLGQMKTGSTSFESFLREAGYILGDQRKFELNLSESLSNNFIETKKLIDSAEAFQDLPFSFVTLELLLFLANHYPRAKYILCIRDSELWYESVDRYFRKRWFHHSKEITWEELEQVQYHGNILWTHLSRRINRSRYAPLNKHQLKKSFENQNQLVREFFEQNPDLYFYECDVTSENFDIAALSNFIGLPNVLKFPHMNRTK